MKRSVDLIALARLDNLIRHKATGSFEDLAEILEMSRSNLFNLMKFLREEMNAPVVYNKNIVSYIYSYTPKFSLRFECNTELNNIIEEHAENENYDDIEIIDEI